MLSLLKRLMGGRATERITPSAAPANVQKRVSTPAAPAPRKSNANQGLDHAVWDANLKTNLKQWHEQALALSSTPDAALLVESLQHVGVDRIRQIPTAAREALALCDNADIGYRQLIARLEKDPSLVQSLLRTANSVAIGGGLQPVLRMVEAIERLGLRTTRSVILANCVNGLLSRPGGPYDAMVNEIWSHMIRASQIARSTAHCVNADNDDAFALCLLHDVGKLVVFDQISALRVQLRRAVTIPNGFLHALLQGVHEELGALAALQWHMGVEAATAIGTHHRSDENPVDSPLGEAIYLAERVDHLLRRGEPIYPESIWLYGKLSGDSLSAEAVLRFMNSDVTA